MQFNNDTIREACFKLISHLMWEQDGLNTNQVPDFIDELSEMTDVFYHEAEGLVDLLEGVPNKEEVMTRAIWYLHDVHAIPPLRGNLEWFKNSLITLIEMLNPNSSIRKSNVVFINWLESGLQQTKKLAVDDKDLDFE